MVNIPLSSHYLHSFTVLHRNPNSYPAWWMAGSKTWHVPKVISPMAAWVSHLLQLSWAVLVYLVYQHAYVTRVSLNFGLQRSMAYVGLPWWAITFFKLESSLTTEKSAENPISLPPQWVRKAPQWRSAAQRLYPCQNWEQHHSMANQLLF